MARHTGPVCRLCRREGVKLFLKGERCYTNKCSVDRRSYAPGQHGQGRHKMTDYGEQLREKQKARRIYGVAERQFRGYYSQAIRARGVTGERLLQILETRLDNVVYRLGLADSRPQARQLVRHGHIIVNGRRVNIPSYLVRANDTITLREQSKKSPLVKELIEKAASRAVPAWLTFDKGTLVGQVVRLPRREEIDIPVRETAIIERYSR